VPPVHWLVSSVPPPSQGGTNMDVTGVRGNVVVACSLTVGTIIFVTVPPGLDVVTVPPGLVTS
jgi:hypothetical protein